MTYYDVKVGEGEVLPVWNQRHVSDQSTNIVSEQSRVHALENIHCQRANIHNGLVGSIGKVLLPPLGELWTDGLQLLCVRAKFHSSIQTTKRR